MGRRRGDHISYRFDLQRLEPRRLLSAAVQSVGVVDPIVAPNPNSSDITIDDISDQIIALRDGSFNGTLLTFTGPESADQYTANIDWDNDYSSMAQILGTRSVILPFANITALKIVDPIEAREFRSFGFQSVAVPKKESRSAGSPQLAAATSGEAL